MIPEPKITILIGGQLNSKSSADIYGKLLRKGVRCLEIDMWDGDDGQPVVTHGNTLCSKVPLQDVVKVIAANAFADDNLFPGGLGRNFTFKNGMQC